MFLYRKPGGADKGRAEDYKRDGKLEEQLGYYSGGLSDLSNDVKIMIKNIY